jgi:hypothetical protein
LPDIGMKVQVAMRQLAGYRYESSGSYAATCRIWV